ncbi:MAG: hypothetical protein C0392_08285 [Syntrophus sp. (in: bacteria)]|nr:hypothetical protein [Syntrophus sp. (in: bacteria)]
MNALRLVRKIKSGFPYLTKEMRSIVSEKTPFFVSRPSMIHLTSYTPCNAKCIFCQWGFNNVHPFPTQSTSMLNSYIPQILHHIAELSGSGTVVSFTPIGEPFLIPSLLDWIRIAGDLRLDFRFTTNGYLLDEAMAEKVVACNPFNVGMSLESLDPDINEIIRPHKNGTLKTIRAIESLLSEKARQRSRITINIKCTLTQINLPSIIDIVKKYGKSEGVIITPQPFEILDGMPHETIDKLWITDLEQLKKVMEGVITMKNSGYHINMEESAVNDFMHQYQDDPHRVSTVERKKVLRMEKKPCTIGNNTIFIENDGGIKLCLYYPAVGNIVKGKTTLKQIWYGEAAAKVRNDIRNCRLLCNLSCLRQKTLRHKIKSYIKM